MLWLATLGQPCLLIGRPTHLVYSISDYAASVYKNELYPWIKARYSDPSPFLMKGFSLIGRAKWHLVWILTSHLHTVYTIRRILGLRSVTSILAICYTGISRCQWYTLSMRITCYNYKHTCPDYCISHHIAKMSCNWACHII